MEQPRRGYRYGVEVYLLADFVLRRHGPVARVLELGCGSGVVSLLLARAGCEVVAIERDPRWLVLARGNVRASGLGERVTVIEADVRSWSGGDFDVVVCNPPWFDPSTGPVSPDSWRASSRSTLHGTPEDFVEAGLRWAPGVCVVGPREVQLGASEHWVRRARYGRLWLGEVQRAEQPDAPAEVLDEAAKDAAYHRLRG